MHPMDRRVLPQAPFIVELLEVFFRHHFSLQLCFHFLSVGGHCFWLMQQQIEPIMKSRSAAQEEESGGKGMLGESMSLLLQLDCSHSSTFRCGALLMYETDERVQQQQFTQRDLIVPRSADLQSRMTANSHATKVNSQVQTCARAMGTVKISMLQCH